MTTDGAPREPAIIALVRRNAAQTVLDAAAHTSSLDFAADRLERNLAPLLEALTLNTARDPDLLAALAHHFDVPATRTALTTAVSRFAHALLESLHARGENPTNPTVANLTATREHRRRGSTHPPGRTPPDRANSPPGRSR